MTDPDGVFVYGTLKSGERNAASVAPAFRGPAVLFKGRLFHLQAATGARPIFPPHPPSRVINSRAARMANSPAHPT